MKLQLYSTLSNSLQSYFKKLKDTPKIFSKNIEKGLTKKKKFGIISLVTRNDIRMFLITSIKEKEPAFHREAGNTFRLS